MRALILLLFLSPIAHAGNIRGHVADTKGEALPFATVFLQGTTLGTTTNASGDYAFAAPDGTHDVVCRYLGFVQASKSITLAASDTATLDFSLQEESRSSSIGEVVVRAGEDPALRIIRKAIAKRQEHLEQVESFQTSTYIKGVLRTRALPDKLAALGISRKDMKAAKGDMASDSEGKGVIYLVEQFADYYSQGPDKRRTVVRRVRESGNPRGLGLSSVPPVITMYANNVRLLGSNPRGFVSPIADGAPGFYRYKLLGETVEAGRIIYALSVEPKRAYEPLFRGRIYLVDGEWALHSLDLTATKTSGLESLDTVRLAQSFLPLPSGIWVIKSQVLYPAVSLFGFDVVGHLATVYDNQKVNAPIPDSIFGGRVVSSYEKDARVTDTVFWNSARPVPLEADEVRDFVVKDSLRIRDEDPVYQDSLRRRSNRISVRGIFIGGISQRGKEDKLRLDISPLLFKVGYNTVEGLVVNPKISLTRRLDSFSSLQLTAAPRYGFSNDRFNAIASLEYESRSRTWGRRGWNIAATGGRYVFQFSPENPVSPLFNTYSTLVEGINHLKIYERWEGAVRGGWRGGNGLRLAGRVSWQRRSPLQNTTSYTWQKESEVSFNANRPETLAGAPWEGHDALLATVSASYQPGWTYALLPDRKVGRGSRWPVFSASYTKGIPDLLGSRADFDRWTVGMKDDVRLRLAGTLQYTLAAGGFFHDKYAALPDLTHYRGNQFSIAGPYLRAFQLMPYYRYSNTVPLYGEGHLEYNLEGLLSNKLPLLRQARWNIVLGGNGLYTSDDLWYGEAFVGVDNLGYKLIRPLRLDLVRSWGSLGDRALAVRVGLKLGGIVRVSASDNGEEEW